MLKKNKPNLLIKDKIGRNGLHHAAINGNSLGIQFTVQLINYWYEKEIGEKIPNGQIIEPAR